MVTESFWILYEVIDIIDIIDLLFKGVCSRCADGARRLAWHTGSAQSLVSCRALEGLAPGVATFLLPSYLPGSLKSLFILEFNCCVSHLNYFH